MEGCTEGCPVGLVGLELGCDDGLLGRVMYQGKVVVRGGGI